MTEVHVTHGGLDWAQDMVARYHYLGTRVPPITLPEAWTIDVEEFPSVLPKHLGCFIVSRPQATRCGGWYGSVDDVAAGRCEVTRWQVLNLARVWLNPGVQGHSESLHLPDYLPGYVDRRGIWRSTLASTALRQLAERVGYEYLVARPPVFLEEPYEVRWLLSYCDTAKHRGIIYRAAGWERLGVNDRGIETWRVRLPPLTEEQCTVIGTASLRSQRSRRIRSDRVRATAQIALPEMVR